MPKTQKIPILLHRISEEDSNSIKNQQLSTLKSLPDYKVSLLYGIRYCILAHESCD